MTAHRCVLSDGPVTGQTILVQGGAGAVGHAAVQIALAQGARVLATVGNPENAERIRSLGAHPILRHAPDVAAQVLGATDMGGVDRIIEVDFAANQAIDAQLIKTNGVIASYSSTSEATPVLDYYAFAAKGANLRFVQGFALPEMVRRDAQDWIARNPLHVPVRATLPLERCAEAHDLVERPPAGAFGQVVLTLDPPD